MRSCHIGYFMGPEYLMIENHEVAQEKRYLGNIFCGTAMGPNAKSGRDATCVTYHVL